jgi:hypothetical protein
MDGDQRKLISVKECEELCDGLLSDSWMVTNRVFLWTEIWLMLAEKLDFYDPMLPPPDPHVSHTPEHKIAEIRHTMYIMLEGHTPDPGACMKVFDRINEV